MAQDHYAELGAEQRRELARLLPKLLLFALLVLISHTLEIKPSDVDVVGVKVVIKDVAVLRGGVALVFIYYFWMVVLAFFEGATLLPVRYWPKVIRSLIVSARQPYKVGFEKRRRRRTIAQVKRNVWISILALNLVTVPFALLGMLLVGCAIVLGLTDAFELCSYIVNRLLWDGA